MVIKTVMVWLGCARGVSTGFLMMVGIRIVEVDVAVVLMVKDVVRD